jgi:hypothetical protein
MQKQHPSLRGRKVVMAGSCQNKPKNVCCIWGEVHETLKENHCKTSEKSL